MRGIEELSELLKSDEINSLGKDLGKRIQDKLERSQVRQEKNIPIIMVSAKKC